MAPGLQLLTCMWMNRHSTKTIKKELKSMKLESLATTVCAVGLAFAMWISPGLQGQAMYDRINVNLTYTVGVGEKTLPPGDYVIQRLPSNGGSPVLLFYSDNGMKFETSALPIPALDINTARDTKLILNHVGDDYYINKIWVQGKDYGYELPMPKSMKARQNERMAEVTVPARSQQTAENETVKVDVNSTSVTAQNTTPATTSTEKAATETEKASTETARNTEPIAQPAEQPTAQPTTQPATPANADNSADRAAPEPEPEPAPAPAEMPATAAGWLTMLLSGGALSGAGLMLRRKR
jgi:hypothetical protein